MTPRIRLLGWAAAVACGLCLLPSAGSAQAGLGVTKACDNGGQIFEGEIINCDVGFEFISDGFDFTRVTPDSTLVPPAFGIPSGQIDIIPFPGGAICTVTDEDFFISAPVNVPADALERNSVCTGAACDPITGVGCSLPCLVCETASVDTDPVTGLSCPGLVGRGEVHMRHQGVEDCRVDTCPTPATFIDLASVEGISATVVNGSITRTQAAQGSSTDTLTCSPVGCPDVTIDKTCDGATVDGQCTGSIIIRVSNDADATATATNCTVEDILDPDGTPTSVALTPDGSVAFDLAPGASLTFNAEVPIDQTTDNEAHIICDPCDGDTAVEAVDRDPCECEVFGEPFKCYAAKLNPSGASFRFVRESVDLEDQFGESSATLFAPFEFCNPVDKNGEGIEDPESHLMCYKLSSRSRPRSRTVLDRDQFGDEQLLVGGSVELCAPAIRTPMAS